MKPVDGAAIDERREHAQAAAEVLVNGVEEEHDVQVFAHSFYELVEEKRGRLHFAIAATCARIVLELSDLTTTTQNMLFS